MSIFFNHLFCSNSHLFDQTKKHGYLNFAFKTWNQINSTQIVLEMDFFGKDRSKRIARWRSAFVHRIWGGFGVPESQMGWLIWTAVCCRHAHMHLHTHTANVDQDTPALFAVISSTHPALGRYAPELSYKYVKGDPSGLFFSKKKGGKVR